MWLWFDMIGKFYRFFVEIWMFMISYRDYGRFDSE